MKRWGIGLAALLLLGTGPAQAVDWLKFCRSGQTVTGLQGGEWACADPTSNSDDTAIISLWTCENTDWWHYDDSDGDSTVSTVTWEIESCPSQSLTGSTADNACELLQGTAALSGDDQESNLASGYMRAKGDEAGTDSEAAGGGGGSRLFVKCAQGSGNN